MRLVFLVAASLFICLAAQAQLPSSLRTRSLTYGGDTLTLDTLSISPLGFRLQTELGETVDTALYHVDYAKGTLVWKHPAGVKSPAPGEKLTATFRVFPVLFTGAVQHKNPSLIGHDASGLVNSYLYSPPPQTSFDLLKAEGLSRSGSISRGITFGNNQDVFVNSSFNLQMAGTVGEDVNILAAITDENLPLQPEGNTQQLQEFDKVFIQLTKDSSRLIAGDYELTRPESYFMNFYKKNQGGYFTTRFRLSGQGPETVRMRLGASGAVSKGKFARNALTAIEGNQGPYRLHGNNNELYVIVLAGSERVFIDGRLMVRGAEQDYIIDYNTAELTFTPRRLITKDSRIVVEFEYSDKSYARSIFYFNDEVESSRYKIKLNVLSEQDSRNQSLLLDLDSTRKQIMADVGDSIQSAFYLTADSVAYSTDQVLYLKKDTTTLSGTFTGIYVYSTSADSAHWRVTFSNVGQGNGDYVQEQTAANGRVFKWVEPVGGIHQGSFAPVSLLITPKKQQMVTLAGDARLSPSLSAGVETALSNYDANLFSTKDKANDAGYAARVYLRQTLRLGTDTNAWRLTNTANYEFSGVNFKPIERYRPVEFERDWNLNTVTKANDEHFITLESALENKQQGGLTYQLRSYLRGADYNGLMNSLAGNYHTRWWKVIAAASYLNTHGTTVNTGYLRHTADVSRNFRFITLGVREMQEDNRYRSMAGDSLQGGSFRFQEFTGYLSTPEDAKTRGLVSYKYRTDDVPRGTSFHTATVAQDASLGVEYLPNSNQSLKITSTFRNLDVKDTSAAKLQPQTLLNRLDYSGTFLKGGLVTSAYYEINTGQELKKEYSYLEVAPGQGLYVWKDYNENGVKELNEFEIAAFANEANYVKIVLPTTEYISTKGTLFSTVFNITPSVFSRPRNGKPTFVSLFSDQFSISLDKNTTDPDLVPALNPFQLSIDDSSLIATNSALRNTIYFNRTHPVYGLDATWSRIQNKSFLVNGFESRAQTSWSGNVRWNITPAFLFTARGENGQKDNRSEFFADRSYTILFHSAEPKLTWQPDAATRFSLSYEYTRKENTYGDNGEMSSGNTATAEARYSTIKTGIFTARFSYIVLQYNGNRNTSLAYEMLEGLSPGKNATWSVSAQRNLGTFMQLSLNYEGRKSEGAAVVHVGGMQFRAFF